MLRVYLAMLASFAAGVVFSNWMRTDDDRMGIALVAAVSVAIMNAETVRGVYRLGAELQKRWRSYNDGRQRDHD